MKQFILLIATFGFIVDCSLGFPHGRDRYDPYRLARRREKQARKAYKKHQAATKFALFSAAGNGGSPAYSLPDAGGSSSNYPPIIPYIPSGSEIAGRLGFLPPIPTDRVNMGLSTVIRGVKTFNVGDVLEGVFTFSTNDNVRSVANTVIGSIFGSRTTTTPRSEPSGDSRKLRYRFR